MKTVRSLTNTARVNPTAIKGGDGDDAPMTPTLKRRQRNEGTHRVFNLKVPR